MTINKLNLPAKENAVQSKINEIIDNFPTGTTVDQTFDGTSANAQSGVAINGELASNYQTKLVSGTNIKTINNTSLLGSGDIDVKDVFVAEYGVTSYSDILSEYNAGKLIFLKSDYLVVGTGEQGTYLIPLEKHNVKTDSTVEFIFSAIDGTVQKTRIINSSNTWSMDTSVFANATLSNVSSISNNSAVKTALDGKADTTLSNVSSIDSNSAVHTALDGKANTNLSNLASTSSTNFDGQWTNSYNDIISSDTSLNGSSDLSKRVPVPNDGYVYEALIIARATTGSASGNLVRVQISTNVLSAGVTICSNRTRSASTVECQGAVIVPIKGVASNSTNLDIGRASGLTGNLNVLRMVAYRRVGTNS